MSEGREGMQNTENRGISEKPISEYTFKEAFAKRQRLTRQKETVSDNILAEIEAEIAETKRREDFLIGEVEQEGGLTGLDQNLNLLREMLDVGQLSPSDIFDALKISPQLDNLAGVASSDPHAGVREWYFRKNLDEIAKDLKKKKEQTLRRQTGQSLATQQVQQPGFSNTVPTEAEKEVFGAGEAFSDRWVKARGIPTVVRYYKSRLGMDEEDEGTTLGLGGGSPGEFKPSELFSSILETGAKDPRSGRMLSYLLEAYPGDSKTKEKFSSALVNGFLAIASLKDGLNSGRIDTLAEALGRGPSPQGIAQWLLFDPETRNSLSLILALQGYEVAGESKEKVATISKLYAEGKQLGEVVAFSDHERIRADQIGDYLNKIREVVGTDPGVVKIAYIIFRILGHPHENSKFSKELIRKYMFGVEDKKYPNRDLAPKDISSFIEKFDDPTKSRDKGNREINLYFKFPPKHGNEKDDETKNKVFLEDVLEKEGVEGLAVSLNRLPAERIVREWRDMQLILDMMDQISDIRAGLGAGSSLLPSERLKAIRSVKELGTVLAKRKLSQETVDRLVDTSKITFTPGSTEVSFWEKTLHGMKVPVGGIGGRKPKVR